MIDECQPRPGRLWIPLTGGFVAGAVLSAMVDAVAPVSDIVPVVGLVTLIAMMWRDHEVLEHVSEPVDPGEPGED